MSMSSATGPAGRTRRIAAAAGLAIVLLVPLLVIFTQYWTSRTQDLTFNQDERRGVQYLLPLTDLLSTMTQQQSAVVHGRGVLTLVVDLAVQLVRKVGDTSNLILDPAIDAYYVMNATLLRIPDVLVDSGQYSDLVKIANAAGKAVDLTTLAELASARGQVQA